MKIYVSSLLLCFTFNAFASCTDTADQVEYRVCVAEKSESSAIKVKEKQAELLKKIKSWDQEPEFINETIKLFEKSVKSFELYKKHQCMYESSAAAGGNGGGAMGASCTTRLNTEYLNTLEKQLAWYESHY